MRRNSSLSRLLALALGAAAVSSLALPVAHAQPRMSARMGGMGGMGGFGGERISWSDVEQYGAMLKLDKEQTEAAKALHEAYMSEYDQAEKATRDAFERVRQEFEDTQDPAVWTEMLPKEMEKVRDKSKNLESTFMNDLKTLLTGEQAGSWPRIERARRRDRSLPGGMLSGESVNLIKLVEEVTGDGPLAETVAQSLERYETELDQAIQERDTKREELAKDMPGFGGRGRSGGGGGMFDFEAIGKMMAEMRKSGLKVRDINDRFAPIIESGLSDDARAKFTDKYNRSKFPSVYRDPYALRAIEAARKFDDLDKIASQGIADLLTSYKRDLAQANTSWAKAIAEEEKEGGGDGQMGGFMRMMSGGGEDQAPSPTAEARKARRALDTATLDKLKALLTEEQIEKLPSREAERGGGMMFGPGGR